MAQRAPLAVLLVLLALVGTVSVAHGQKPLEYDVKAAFLYNFVHFIQWPDEAFSDRAEPLTIGIFGENPFGDALERIVDGETVGQRPITVTYADAMDELASCQVVFTTLSDEMKLARLLAYLDGKSILTVGDFDAFVECGGVVGFVSDGGRIRFDINLSVATDAGLKLSSKLLKVARRTIEG